MGRTGTYGKVEMEVETEVEMELEMGVEMGVEMKVEMEVEMTRMLGTAAHTCSITNSNSRS